MATNEMTANDGRSKGPLDRFLGIFTDVRGGEGLTALFLFLNVFVLLSSYYLLKTVREGLIIVAGGAEVKSYTAAAIAGILIVLVPLYSAFASRVSRVKLINGVTLFFIACLVGFFLWARTVGVPSFPPEGAATAAQTAQNQAQLALAISFFVWVGIFNVMIIAQFWAFANDVYTVEQGKRLFAIVVLGASLGAIAGSAAAKPLIKSYGLYSLMAMAAGALVLCMILTNLVHVREKRHEGERRSEKEQEREVRDSDAPITGRSGFALVFSDRYLFLIAMLMLLLNLVNSTGEYILGATLKGIAKDMVAHGQLAESGASDWVSGFYSSYFTWVNIVSAIFQAFVVSRVIKWLGVGKALLIMPLVSLGAYAALAFVPLLSIIRTAKIAENSLDYSLNNTARQALFLPTSREAKYKAKQAIDTFFVRFGDVVSAGLVFAGTTWLAFSPKNFAMANAAIVLLWLGIAFALGRAFTAMAGEKTPEELKKAS